MHAVKHLPLISKFLRIRMNCKLGRFSQAKTFKLKQLMSSLNIVRRSDLIGLSSSKDDARFATDVVDIHFIVVYLQIHFEKRCDGDATRNAATRQL